MVKPLAWLSSKLNPASLRAPRGWAAVHFAGDKLEYVLAREHDGHYRVVQEAAADSPAGLRDRIDPGENQIVTSLGCEDVLCRALLLPTVQEGELRQMLDLQIDQLTPVPLDEVVYDFEPLEQWVGAAAADAIGSGASPAAEGTPSGAGLAAEQGPSAASPEAEQARSRASSAAEQARFGASTLVLVAIARKSVVNERVAALENAGLPPERVGVDALSLFHALARGGTIPRDERLSTLIWLHPGVAHLIVYTRGWPLLVRSVFRGADEEWRQAGLGEELRRTQLATQTEWPGRETGPVLFVLGDPALEPVAREVASTWAAEAEFLLNGAVPSPARCLCPAAREERRCNLLPDEWRQRRRVAHLRRVAIRCGIALAALYVLVLAGFLVARMVQQVQLRRLQTTAAGLRPQYDQAQKLHGTLVALESQLDTKFSALDTLREVSLLLPPSVKLDSFTYKRDETVAMKGQADTAQTAYDFIGRLEKCELFSAVKYEPLQDVGGLTKFGVVATLRSAGSKPNGGG